MSSSTTLTSLTNATMRRLANHYVTLLRSIVASPETSVSRLAILEAAEREELVAVGFRPHRRICPG